VKAPETAAGRTEAQMPDWADDPRIHVLMTHLGKTGPSGKPTKLSLLAGEVDKHLVQIERRRRDLERDSAKLTELREEGDHLSERARVRDRECKELLRSIDEARRDLRSQNPNADLRLFNRDAEAFLTAFDREYDAYGTRLEPVRRDLAAKQSGVRRLERRVDHLRKMVELRLHQAGL